MPKRYVFERMTVKDSENFKSVSLKPEYTVDQALERLAAYEDIGMDPDLADMEIAEGGGYKDLCFMMQGKDPIDYPVDYDLCVDCDLECYLAMDAKEDGP